VIVAFEGMVLVGALSAFVSWVFGAGLPQSGLDVGYDASFSGQRFGIVVGVAEERRTEIEGILKENGAEETHYVLP
jgi:hypothetical protein